MAIPDEEVAQVRAATDIVGLISEHAALRQSGRRWTGLCPFHGERTPSFSVNAEEGLYYCFGCQASGDAISFVRAVEHLDFADAVRHLAERAGIVLHESAAGGEDHRRRSALLAAMERAVVWYHESLLSSPGAGRARDYLRSRGYDGAVVRQFRLGWAPDEWDALAQALGLSERVLTGTGLGFVNRRGRLQDSFRNRIVFPICDPSGHAIALGGRVLPPPKGGASEQADRAPEPKYKNSSETAIYVKRRTLYALNWAKKDIVATGEIVVCEGYTDVIGCFQAGVPRAVATCGTSLAEEHFTLLRNFARRIVLAYDQDSAGQSATGRVYEWERKHDVDVYVAALPAGADPGQLAHDDPEALRQALGEARPFLQFRIDRIFDGAPLDTAEGRARAADEALQAIAEHPDDLVRDQYVMTVSDRCRLDPDLLRSRLGAARQRIQVENRGRAGHARAGGSRTRGERDNAESEHLAPPIEEREAPPRRSSRVDDPASRPGLEALRFAVHRPEAVADRLESVLFVDDLQRRAFETLLSSDDLHQAIDDAPPDVAELLRRVAVEEPVVVEGVTPDPVDALITNLTRTAARRALRDLDVAARTTPGDFSDTAATSARVKLWIEDLDDPAGGSDTSKRLLAWLSDRREG
jgi:DNA primase